MLRAQRERRGLKDQLDLQGPKELWVRREPREPRAQPGLRGQLVTPEQQGSLAQPALRDQLGTQELRARQEQQEQQEHGDRLERQEQQE